MSLLLAISSTCAVRGDTFTDADWVSLNTAPPTISAAGGIESMLSDGEGGVYVAFKSGSEAYDFGGYPFLHQIGHWDGTTWTSVGPGVDGLTIAMVTDGANLYAGGLFTPSGLGDIHVVKWDGSKWSSLGPGLSYTVSSLALVGTNLYAGGGFSEAGSVTVNGIARWDGISWHALGSGMNGWVYAILPHGNDLYVAGDFSMAGGIPANNIAKWDGTNWFSLGTGLIGEEVNQGAGQLAMIGNDLYVGGWFSTAGGIPASRVARWDGTNWFALGSGIVGNALSQFAVSGSDLYVSGFFDTAGGVSVTNIARWNGTSWSGIPAGYPLDNGGTSLVFSGTNLYVGSGHEMVQWNGGGWSTTTGPGLTNNLLAMAVSGDDLYVIQEMFPTDDNPLPDNMILKRDGSSWSEIPANFDEIALVLAAIDTNLYVGGFFSTVDGIPVNYMAQWDGTSWSGLGSGLDQPPDLFQVSGTNLYIAGTFSSAGGVPANRIARWDGNSWSALGSGVDDFILTMATEGNDLYVAGSFTIAGGVPVNHIAKWDGQSWSALGSGFHFLDRVSALAVSGTNLFAAGYFTVAGGVAANNVARWDGNVWSPLGSGLAEPSTLTGGRALALAVNGNDLYVGGFFTDAGGAPVRCLAKWDGSAWSAVGSGVDYTIHQMETDNAGHLFIRGDFQFGGTIASPRIVQANIGLSMLGGRFENLNFSPLTGFSSTFMDASVGQPYRIQSRPVGAVGGWIDFTNFTYNGPVVITDSAANSASNRLYRATSP